MNSYVPGAHNIAEKAAQKRVKRGWKALGISLVYVVVIFALGVPQILMLIVGVPLFVGVRQVLEGKSRFSVSYGLHGLYDMGEGVKHSPEDEETQQKDRTKSQSILFFATLAGVLGALFCYIALV